MIFSIFVENLELCHFLQSITFLSGNLLKRLDVSSEENGLLTTYGKLQPPLGKHRLKVFSCFPFSFPALFNL